jgi:hypothetical protein
MKLPSIFKTPRHQQFRIQPRYYDPIKEEIDARVARIRGELQEDEAGDLDIENREYMKTRISSSFQRRARGTGGVKDNTVILRLVIMGVLFGGVAGFIQYGNDVIYGMLVLIPLYFVLRFKKII